jgi:serine phosphatase RsbU (regulator of sigma subunit)
MEKNITENIANSLKSKKAMWKLTMKSRIKSKFLFFAIPIALITLFLAFFGNENQFNDFLPFLAGSMFIIMLYNFRKTEKANIIITTQKEELDKKNEIIEEKNKEIIDSITYALRIQKAKLPKKEEVYTSFPQSFILFKPKDIVSGDFYFFQKNNQSVFIAAADCTGHGVPGALMSMICSEKLDDAVSQSVDTSVILKQLNKGIKTSLRQSDSDESTRDGMDIALCSVDTQNRSIKYAGANRPLWIIRNGQTEVEEIKATKTAIGGLTEDNQHFDTHEIILQQGDTFYICTDGYADQFSGQDGRKLMTRKLKEILVSIQSKTMPEQETYLDNFIENWKAGTEQVDDILVIGVRL